ncbi:hypothetical protein HN709_03000 [Candidatus Peregrinibacteria bacterium]|jgi:hypothetical protein|nr:hypothetical protein [Candidatus Peregrinibacteria bacterium]MBT7736631.1 hypothetical protein [Candidatus Peregrinibacteria bacterium]
MVLYRELKTKIIVKNNKNQVTIGGIKKILKNVKNINRYLFKKIEKAEIEKIEKELI